MADQLRINGDNRHQRCDLFVLINCVPIVPIELLTLGINPCGAIEQIADDNLRQRLL
jgi:type I restriction enzyme R subunit